MADEQGAIELRGTADRTVVVARGVLLRRAHVTLGVDRVIETVARRRSDSHTGLEDGTALTHAHQRVETAVAPAPDADVVLVDIRQRAEVERCLHLVLCFEVAKLQISAFLELCATATCAASVDADHDEALLSEVLVEGATIAHRTGIP